MSYSAAHLSELGLSLWRLRSDVDANNQAEADRAQQQAAPEDISRVAAEASVPAPSTVNPLRQPAPENVATATQQRQAQQDLADQDEALAARAAAIARMDWDALHKHVQAQSRPPAQQAVFGVGARDAQVMVIGEAPGAQEDKAGEPFVGPAGQLLDQMLAAIGLSRAKNVYIANICKFRPPDNRDPRPDEVAQDMPYLLRQIELIAPRLLIAVGRVAAQNLLDSKDPLGRMRGREHRFGEQGLTTLVTYHPSYLLRSPREKAKAWQDLKRVRALLLDAR